MSNVAEMGKNPRRNWFRQKFAARRLGLEIKSPGISLKTKTAGLTKTRIFPRRKIAEASGRKAMMPKPWSHPAAGWGLS